MNGYELSRNWFNWCFENPEKIKPNHTALYFFAIEHCNRLGWKEKFGLPTTMAKEAIGIRSYNTYINTLNELVEWGFVKMIERSKNQHSSNIVALSKFDKALDSALDKAFVKHGTKQSESTGESNSSIVKPITSKPITKEHRELTFREQVAQHTTFESTMLDSFADYWTESKPQGKKMLFEMKPTFDIKRRLGTWSKNNFNAPKEETTDFKNVTYP